jgi:hypothetical protein
MWLLIAAVVIAMGVMLVGGPLVSKLLHSRQRRRQNKHNKP